MRLALCLALCLALSGALAAKDVADSKADAKITVRLVETIQKKNLDQFTKELQNKDMDVNQPTPNGRLPIIEAVKSKVITYVDGLIQHGVQVSVKEPGTGASPIQVACQGGLYEIARMLLAYGADPKAADKKGKSAFDVASGADVKELLTQWELHGAMAFEDPPGAWRRASQEGSDVQFWAKDGPDGKREARWNIPPSCGWQRLEKQDGAPITYLNYVTGQQVHKTPAPLAWRLLNYQGQEVWYNWARNFTQQTAPDEMPQYLLDEAMEHKNVRWYNPKTGQFAWEDPKAHTHWRPMESEDGKGTFYYNLVTGDSTWEIPDELAWTKKTSPESGEEFYWNQKTGESTWDVPDSEAWIKQNEDL